MDTMILIIMATLKMITPFICTLMMMMILHGVIYQITGFSIYNEFEKKMLKF